MLMFLAPTLANVYQVTLATEKANVKVHISQNLVSIKNCYIHNANVFKGLAISKGGCAGTEKWWVIRFFTLCKGWVDQFSANLTGSAYLIHI